MVLLFDNTDRTLSTCCIEYLVNCGKHCNNRDLDNSKEYNLMLINTKYDLYFNARGLVICTAGKATSFYIVETLTRI